MKEPYNVRRVDPHDLSQIKGIADRELREEYGMDLLMRFFEEFRGGFFVAEREGDVLGFILAVPLDRSTMRILMLAVREECTQTGIGSELLRTMKEYTVMRMMNSIVLEVSGNNETAVRFYKNRGFQQVRMIPNYYTDGRDAMVMRSYLPV